MYYAYLIVFVFSMAFWAYETYLVWKQGEDTSRMWIALLFVMVSNLGMNIYR